MMLKKNADELQGNDRYEGLMPSMVNVCVISPHLMMFYNLIIFVTHFFGPDSRFIKRSPLPLFLIFL